MSTRNQLLNQVLILKYQTGDESAFEQLVERHQGSLRYFIRRLGGEPCGC